MRAAQFGGMSPIAAATAPDVAGLGENLCRQERGPSLT
jgi:hypothetical protein